MTAPVVVAVARQGGVRLVAAIRDGTVTDLWAESIERPSRIGAVFLGRVTGHDRASGGAFVALGDGGPPGFLAKGGGAVGEPVLVQVADDARAEKGPVLTRDVALAGRTLVHVPRSRGVAVSAALGAEARARWRTALPAGWIVRRQAEAAGEAAVRVEAARLEAQWHDLEARARTAEPPACLLPAAGQVERVLRETEAVASVACEDGAEARRLAAWADEAAPELAERIRIDTADLDSALADALAPEVSLPSGGRLTIEPTRALIAIDVDTGGARDKAAVDRAAVAAIARHLRLRGLGGQIVVDFVTDPPGRGGKAGAVTGGGSDPLIDALVDATAEDPSPVVVSRLRPFGLVALTRRRQGPSLADVLGG